jgi:hypothetical protein
MNAVVEANGLGKRYGRRWALADCTLAIPAGRVVGLFAAVQFAVPVWVRPHLMPAPCCCPGSASSGSGPAAPPEATSGATVN